MNVDLHRLPAEFRKPYTMIGMKKIASLFVLFLSFAFALAQGPEPKKEGVNKLTLSDATLPSKDEIDAALKRTFGYDPSVSWEIYEVKPSVVPGMTEVVVSVNKQPPTHVYVSPDGSNAIIASTIPFGPNPFAPARADLHLAAGPRNGAQPPVTSMGELRDSEAQH